MRGVPLHEAKPERDGIQEILAAGRAPGVIIRGEAADKELSDRAKWPVLPLAYGGRNASKVEADAERMVARKRKRDLAAKRTRGTSRKVRGLERIGSVPMIEFAALQREHGHGTMATDRLEILKRRGRIWGDV